MNPPAKNSVLPSSFRDPSGFLFRHESVLYRQINQVYRSDYDLLMQSGLYEELANDGSLIPHEETDSPAPASDRAYKVIKPEEIAFISYPYEWCFSQLRDAALLTLKIQKLATERGMSLKDASAYNIQFHRGRPILIDTLSFEKYVEGKPWVAYRQFCQHFLAPLALMSYADVRLSLMLRTHLDGIPLDLAAKLLPRKTALKFGLALHIHAHARSQKRYADRQVDRKLTARGMSKQSLLGLIANLESAVEKLKWRLPKTEWGGYYDDTNYSGSALEGKRDLVKRFIHEAKPNSVWDLGANTGLFSRIASTEGIFTVAFDIDPVAVEKNYLEVVNRHEKNLLPLILDLTNPSPSLGWHHRERDSLIERGPVDLAMALALIHHLAIGNNLPLDHVARFFSDVCEWLIIEFVPKSDSQVKRLLSTREDIFDGYDQETFETEFGALFDIVNSTPVSESERTLYLMRRKSA